MRRKTRPRVVWLPNTNTASLGAFGRSTLQRFEIDQVATAPGSVTVAEIPIIIDSQDDVNDPANSLSDIENSGYRLRRIVGKLHCYAEQVNADSEAQISVTAALIIRRSNPVDGVSFAVSTGDETLVDPGDNNNQGDPWIWRRNWILWNNVATGAGSGFGPGPASTDEYGSVADGPHVDAKTARIVSSEERLFLDVSITNVNGNLGGTTTVQVLADLRVLASMRTSTGNRRNASR